MGFFSKIKQSLGIGTVAVELQCPAQVQKNSGIIPCTVTLTAKSDQHVLEVEAKLVETWSTGRGDDKKEKEFDLGEIKVSGEFQMKAGETKQFTFELPYSLVKSNADELKEKGGAMGALGSVAAFANAEKSTYEVNVTCDVKGAALDPSDSKNIKLVE